MYQGVTWCSSKCVYYRTDSIGYSAVQYSRMHLLKKVNQALMVGRLDKTENHEKRRKTTFLGVF